jgi:TonB family protein
VSGPVAPTAEHDSYLRALRRQIHDALGPYPLSAFRREITGGTVLLELILHPTGKIEQIVLLESSRHDVFDKAALEAVRSVRPRPFPPDVPHHVLRWHVTIVFELKLLKQR